MITITKAKYKDKDNNWVSLTFDDGSVGQTSTTDGIRRQHTDLFNEAVANGLDIEPYKTAEEYLNDMFSLANTEIASYIQETVTKYNEIHELSFANVHSCGNYRHDDYYTHVEFCKDVWKWNVDVWEYARAEQGKMESGSREFPYSIQHFIEELPKYGGTM